jgi:hypothetical protein
VSHAEVHEASFFDAGDDLDGVTERRSCAIQESAFATRAPERISADDAHALGFHIAQALPKPLQTFDRAIDCTALEPTLLVETRGKPNHFTKAIYDDDLPVRVPRDHHVEAVGPEIYGSEDIGDGRTSH